MSAEYFLDTNILIYTFNESEPAKRARALELVAGALHSGTGMISTQVVQELLNVATRKFTPPLKREDCLLYFQKVLNPLCKVYPSPEYYQLALEIQERTGYSFYDSLIIAGAIIGGCAILYTEDLHPGQRIQNVEIRNPFA
jgi:predicted nucleic acid-binding protein